MNIRQPSNLALSLNHAAEHSVAGCAYTLRFPSVNNNAEMNYVSPVNRAVFLLQTCVIGLYHVEEYSEKALQDSLYSRSCIWRIRFSLPLRVAIANFVMFGPHCHSFSFFILTICSAGEDYDGEQRITHSFDEYHEQFFFLPSNGVKMRRTNTLLPSAVIYEWTSTHM